ncbi:purine-nucleoside phosphorylase [Lacibacter sp. H407]|uniref:purine-nucleoside phosphorylase n=1 Tax=Lacibacter sp. H407 TaxID=3133423 RepID=UPI0030C2DAAE
MNNIVAAIQESASFLAERGMKAKPVVGIVLGTGLGALVNKIEVELTIPYTDIPHFPQATVEFHKGNLLYGKIGGVQVIAMQGRFHYYEGYSMQQVTFPIRVMKALGVETLLLSNAAGGMNLHYKKGDLILIDDHINMLPDNPLRGLSDPSLGERFVDMSAPYDASLQQRMLQKATEQNIPLHKGTYVAVMGPNLETRAEYRWLRSTGADMVGMSTVPEVIVANQIGLKCLAVSVITDECDPENLKPVNIAEIIEVAGKADEKLSTLFASLIEGLV